MEDPASYPEYVLAIHSSKRLLVEQISPPAYVLADAIISLTLAKGQRHEVRMWIYFFASVIAYSIVTQLIKFSILKVNNYGGIAALMQMSSILKSSKCGLNFLLLFFLMLPHVCTSFPLHCN